MTPFILLIEYYFEYSFEGLWLSLFYYLNIIWIFIRGLMTQFILLLNITWIFIWGCMTPLFYLMNIIYNIHSRYYDSAYYWNIFLILLKNKVSIIKLIFDYSNKDNTFI